MGDLNYPGHLIRCEEPQPPQPEAATSFVFVDTDEQLAECAAHLAAQPEVAVDLEHHDLHSFEGVTCLIQASSRTRDFVIDALVLRHAIPSALGPVFEDPKIVKVLHEAREDVSWLQRDFGIWIVTLFDTAVAARVLQQRFSLAALMQDVCGVHISKSHQRADWRLRPIPDAMMDYARRDTHSLLYVYDVLRRRLLDTPPSEVPEAQRVEEWPGGVKCAGAAGPPRGRHDAPGMLGAFATVLERSRQVSLRMYKSPNLPPSEWRQAYSKSTKTLRMGGLDDRQRTTFRMLYEWRYTVARSKDESMACIVTRENLFKLAREQPTTANAVRSVLRFRPKCHAAINATDVARVVRESLAEPPDEWPRSRDGASDDADNDEVGRSASDAGRGGSAAAEGFRGDGGVVAAEGGPAELAGAKHAPVPPAKTARLKEKPVRIEAVERPAEAGREGHRAQTAKPAKSAPVDQAEADIGPEAGRGRGRGRGGGGGRGRGGGGGRGRTTAGRGRGRGERAARNTGQ
ncbi:unnamed protein product [Pedinophyceae sp. YPF-701]|nr:unnamed protein product [Pedinophyceae sp. YPF-701]